MKKLLFILPLLLLVPIAFAKPNITIHSPLNQTYDIYAIPVNISVNETSNLTIYLKTSDFDGNLTGYIINQTF